MSQEPMMTDPDLEPRSPVIPRTLLHLYLRHKKMEAWGPELEELFGEKVRRGGRARAAIWYWRQLIGFVIRWHSIKRHPDPGLYLRTVDRYAGGGHSTLESVLQDARFGLRTLRRKPVFTLVAVVTLCLGIGATTTIYSIVDAVLLRSLPYPDADRLVSIWTSRLNDRDEWVTESLYPPEYRELLARSTTLENVALYFYAGGSLQGRGDPMNLIVGEGSATLPDVAGIQPMLGRWFRPEEVGPEYTYVTVLGHSLWKDRFGADPDVIGTTVLLEHHPYTVIGVMPPEFRFRIDLFEDTQGLLSPQDSGERPVWVPMGHNYGSNWYWAREGWSFEAIARLRPGVSVEAANAEIEALVRGDIPEDRIRVHMARRDQLEVAGLPARLLLLAVPSIFLLLIACGNVATLILGESEGRRAEIATRAAIGAGTSRIVRQLLTESVILGLAGSVAGIALAFGATHFLVAFAPATSAIENVRVNLSVLGFSSLAGVAAGIGFGLIPALMLGRRRGSANLHGHGTRLTGGGRRRTDLVIGVEVALTVVLLVSGGLFTRTLVNLTAVDMGFDPGNLVALRAAIEGFDPDIEWTEAVHLERIERRKAAYLEMIDRMEAVPGVEAATGSWAMPLLMSLWNDEVETETGFAMEGGLLPRLSYDIVIPNYHETMRIPLLAGRFFTPADGPGAPPVVILSRSTADYLWPEGPALGQRVRFSRVPEWHTVVGVVEDVRYGGLDSEPRSPIYLPYLQNPYLNGIRLVLTARTTGDPAELIPQLEAAARSAFPEVLLREARIMSSVVSETATDQRYRALLVVCFGLAAVVLTAVGIFGVVARAVARRSRELAIRMALGADSGSLRSLIMGRTLLAGGIGLGAGLLAAGLGSRFIQSFLFGVPGSDPLTFSVAILVVLLVSLTAGYIPARRLLHLQPARLLSDE